MVDQDRFGDVEGGGAEVTVKFHEMEIADSGLWMLIFDLQSTISFITQLKFGI